MKAHIPHMPTDDMLNLNFASAIITPKPLPVAALFTLAQYISRRSRKPAPDATSTTYLVNGNAVYLCSLGLGYCRQWTLNQQHLSKLDQQRQPDDHLASSAPSKIPSRSRLRNPDLKPLQLPGQRANSMGTLSNMRPKLRLNTTLGDQEFFQFPLPPSSATPTERMSIKLTPEDRPRRRSIRTSRSPAPPLRRSKTFPPPETPIEPAPPLPSTPVLSPDGSAIRFSDGQRNQERLSGGPSLRPAPLHLPTRADARSSTVNASPEPMSLRSQTRTTEPLSTRSSTSMTASPTSAASAQALDSLVVELKKIFEPESGGRAGSGSDEN